MLLLGACAALCISCGDAAGTAPDPNGPPTSMILTGAWLGTLTRATGLTTIGVGWVDKPGGSFGITNLTFSGPVTLTHEADRLAGTLDATLAGTATAPTISLAIAVLPGDDSSTLKTCAIQASATKVTTFTDTSIVANVSVSFSGCEPLLKGRSSATETDTLTLGKLYTR